MDIRDATADDVPAIRALFNALIPTTTGTWRDHLADDAELAAWFADRTRAGDTVLVATEDGEVLGYCSWVAFRGGPRFPGYDRTAELSIHVWGDRHGQGVGRALLEALVDRGRQRGLHVLVAAIDGENDASIAFHRALGFVEVARMPEVGWKFDRWLDLILMQRILDGPAEG